MDSRFLVKWVRRSGDGRELSVHYLFSSTNRWHFKNRRESARRFAFDEAVRAVFLYFSSSSSGDGGKRDSLLVERETDGKTVVVGRSRYSPDGGRFELADESFRSAAVSALNLRSSRSSCADCDDRLEMD